MDAFANAVSTADINAFGPTLAGLQYCIDVWPRVVRAVEHLIRPLGFGGVAYGAGCSLATASATIWAMISS